MQQGGGSAARGEDVHNGPMHDPFDLFRQFFGGRDPFEEFFGDDEMFGMGMGGRRRGMGAGGGPFGMMMGGSLFDDMFSGMDPGEGSMNSFFESTSAGGVGGGVSKSQSTKTIVKNGRKYTKTTTTIKHPDGRVETHTDEHEDDDDRGRSRLRGRESGSNGGGQQLPY